MNEITTPIEKNNQRVLSSYQLAEAYGTDTKVISYNFNGNKSHFTEGKHYFVLIGDEMRAFRDFHDLPKNLNKIYLWTESGALLHAKSLNTEKAWEVYEHLVDTYFRYRALSDEKKTLATLNTANKALEEANLLLDCYYTENEKLLDRLKKRAFTDVISYEEQKMLKAIAKEVITDIFGNGNTATFRIVGQSAYSQLWGDFRSHFTVNSYRCTPKYRFYEALVFIEEWEPSMELLDEANEADDAFQRYLSRYFDDYDNDNYEQLVAEYPVIMEDFINAIRSSSERPY